MGGRGRGPFCLKTDKIVIRVHSFTIAAWEAELPCEQTAMARNRLAIINIHLLNVYVKRGFASSMMPIWGLSSGRMKQQQHTHKKKKEKEENKEQKKVLEHKHKNTNNNREAYERKERKEPRETIAKHIRDREASNC